MSNESCSVQVAFALDFLAPHAVCFVPVKLRDGCRRCQVVSGRSPFACASCLRRRAASTSEARGSPRPGRWFPRAKCDRDAEIHGRLAGRHNLLRRFADDPARVKESRLPTMPHDGGKRRRPVSARRSWALARYRCAGTAAASAALLRLSLGQDGISLDAPPPDATRRRPGRPRAARARSGSHWRRRQETRDTGCPRRLAGWFVAQPNR